jgi:HAMP domain-containing protein
MADPNEIEALKASWRGALATSESLLELRTRIESFDPRGEIDAADLDEIARVTLAHAVAAQALRGFVNSMRTRRGASAA